jgi:hypothetical protein
MQKEKDNYLIYLSLLNTFSALMDGLSDLMALVFFITIVTPVEADGVTPTGAPDQLQRTPVISLPLRNILSTPFFRQFSVIYYPSLYRDWGNKRLFNGSRSPVA